MKYQNTGDTHLAFFRSDRPWKLVQLQLLDGRSNRVRKVTSLHHIPC
jgi:hypothetical protein